MTTTATTPAVAAAAAAATATATTAATGSSTAVADGGTGEGELSAEEALDLILQTILPCLLLGSLTVVVFPGRWRTLREKLERLRCSLSDAPVAPDDRCHDPSLPGGKLLLQSDLDIGASSLSLRLHDLDLLLRSGLLQRGDHLHRHHHHRSSSEAADPSTGAGDNAIVLLQPGASASKEDLSLYVRDLFIRLQIGGVEFKRKALDSLLNLFATGGGGGGEGDGVATRIAALVAREGDVAFLIHLMEASCEQHAAREQAAAAVCFLATGGGLGPLLRLLETGSAPLKEKAAAAVEAITTDATNAWAVPAYGGVPVLIEACRQSRSHGIRSGAAGSLRNLAALVVDARAAMAEEGAVPVLLELLSPSPGGGGVADDSARMKAVQCLGILATTGGDGSTEVEKVRSCIIQEGGLHKLLQLFREMAAASSELAEHVLRGILALSASPSAMKILSSSSAFFLQLTETIKHGNPAMQQIAATLLSELPLGEETKRSMTGVMAALLKLMESPKPANSQEVAARALVSLLAVRSSRKELSKDEKSMTKLVGLLDPANDWVRKELPVAVICMVAGGGAGCRRRVAAWGACQHLQRLAEAEVPGARKALQRMTGGRIKNIFSSIAWRE
ncbi:unnamed protein product [Spirodela intermedia]|uniref:DUF7032 domain-containing protein n=1 Tax=Spirodela intermedia TaxID=51605 RepID=A0A7I8JK19_SPIIN|nr:unnamed protein product [Spirodela intermedia]CAA6670527.1 unnamed protein product [Spirodela intermedia]